MRNRTAAHLVMTIAPVPANTTANVPTNSALHFFVEKDRQTPARVSFCCPRSNRQNNMNFSAITTAAVAADL
jgi:hypothetical protein